MNRDINPSSSTRNDYHAKPLKDDGWRLEDKPFLFVSWPIFKVNSLLKLPGGEFLSDAFFCPKPVELSGNPVKLSILFLPINSNS